MSPTPAGGTACHRNEDGAFVLVSQEGHEFPHALITTDFLTWEIVTAHEHELGLVVTRTMRELVREHFVDRGALMLHGAAAVLPDGTGVVLAGPSGAGKTSASVQLAPRGRPLRRHRPVPAAGRRPGMGRGRSAAVHPPHPGSGGRSRYRARREGQTDQTR
ncbi:hypothetical protein GCM10023238_22550 [Streptomyces heliomycini]